MCRILQGGDEAVQDGELDAQFEAVDAGLVGGLDVEVRRVGECEKGDVEADDEDVGVDQMVHYFVDIMVALAQRMQVLHPAPRFDDVQDGDNCFLHEKDADLDAIPD